jgi:hypothetical protein
MMLQMTNQSGTRFLRDFDFIFGIEDSGGVNGTDGITLKGSPTGGVTGTGGIETYVDAPVQAGSATAIELIGVVACSATSGACRTDISGRVSCCDRSHSETLRTNCRRVDVCRSDNITLISFTL